MKVLTWNLWGLENPRGFRTLRDLIKKEDPKIFFLHETKVKVNFFSSKKFVLSFDNALAVECEGRSGDSAFL